MTAMAARPGAEDNAYMVVSQDLGFDLFDAYRRKQVMVNSRFRLSTDPRRWLERPRT